MTNFTKHVAAFEWQLCLGSFPSRIQSTLEETLVRLNHSQGAMGSNLWSLLLWVIKLLNLQIVFLLADIAIILLTLIVFYTARVFLFKIFLKFHKLLHQYLTCKYLFEYICNGDPKCIHEIPKSLYFWTFDDILDQSSAHACRVVMVNT